MMTHLAELYRFQAFIATLMLRELRVRYRGSFLGSVRPFLNPLLLVLADVLAIEQIRSNRLVLLFFLSPIHYPVSTMPTTLEVGQAPSVPLGPRDFRNPAAGLVQSYRSIFFGGGPDSIPLGMATVFAPLALWGGYRGFDRLRSSLAEEA
jgi:ABC-type polysaccharide/polyol phosphate export permease